ncbi:enoyl-CoA hydratase [Pseudonocardia asaccharolytica]|uniref:Enoyl-CoA hydratase n=1 Tax=Pseudonocardia asaccharolytica DSM 44247 = NBRC 16224 TaxID=1123024 RepID=A0A511CUV7_9PSEU|nr:enoyl-CoA hydratase [Pseudonocardia asaccharolytica]GEL16341.1 enoyl-CoA hydratase [Pseudonocardia asaccharolytica DSM 44247 = NBRC 16224]
MSAEVRTEISDRVALLTLSNPQRRNALDLELSAKLVAALQAAAADEEIGAVVLTGEPPAFCAGGDLSELQNADPDTLKTVYSGFLEVANFPLPTIAAVNGPAVGAGLNLALACDVRLAGPSARFDTRFMQLGLHPGGGYTWMIDRILGPQGAAAMTLFCDVLDAAEAERVGLVWRRYAGDEGLRAGALDLAARAAAAPRDLITTTKASMRITAAMTAHADATELEVRAQAASVRSAAFQERVEALQKKISKR